MTAGRSSVTSAACRATSIRRYCSGRGSASRRQPATCSPAPAAARGTSSTWATACCHPRTRTSSRASPSSSRRVRSKHVSETAVILMAYGSPERVADVPAYYADIRGGRPIAQELLDDLVARYRSLGIEDSNPLNAITEATRAALQEELGLPVYTGMKHWTPRIADAVESALEGRADEIVGLVLAPHYSALSIAGYRGQVEAAISGRAQLHFVESWYDEPGFV